MLLAIRLNNVREKLRFELFKIELHGFGAQKFTSHQHDIKFSVIGSYIGRVFSVIVLG